MNIVYKDPEIKESFINDISNGSCFRLSSDDRILYMKIHKLSGCRRYLVFNLNNNTTEEVIEGMKVIPVDTDILVYQRGR